MAMNTYQVISCAGSPTMVQADKFTVGHPDQVQFLVGDVEIAYFNAPQSVVLVTPPVPESVV